MRSGASSQPCTLNPSFFHVTLVARVSGAMSAFSLLRSCQAPNGPAAISGGRSNVWRTRAEVWEPSHASEKRPSPISPVEMPMAADQSGCAAVSKTTGSVLENVTLRSASRSLRSSLKKSVSSVQFQAREVAEAGISGVTSTGEARPPPNGKT